MNDFNKKLEAFFAMDEGERDYDNGALMLLQLTGNKILYGNISANPKHYADFINHELQKHYNIRLQDLNHQMVEKMRSAVKVIEEVHGLQSPEKKEYRKGKRADHDSLPEEIQALYTEHLGIIQRMRDVQTRLRLLSSEGKTCLDNDEYPYLKELIELDTRDRENWERYDNYIAGQGQTVKKLSPIETDKKYTMLVNINKGKYKKHPTDVLKIQIVDWYKEIARPTEKLTRELKELGIID